MIRSFIALPLPAKIRKAIARFQQGLAGDLSEVRWSNPETLHLTLRFLGDQTEDSLEKLGEIVLSVGRSCSPFSLTLSGVGAFPHWSRSRVLWLGFEPSVPLDHLYQQLSDQLAEIGIPRETRKFHPHLTLGRSRHQGVRLPPREDVAGAWTTESFTSDNLVLYESQLGPGGAQHLPRTRARLGENDV